MGKIELEEEHWCPVPLWFLSLAEITNIERVQALDYCKELEKNHEGRILSNVGGWQSKDLYYLTLINTPLAPYLNKIIPALTKCAKSLGVVKEIVLDNIWININYKNSYNSIHTHPRSFISGVFYLTDNNSKIVFNRVPGIDTYHLDNYKSNNNTLLSYRVIHYKPDSTKVVIFPSWLPHSVEKNEGEVERVSVAFNTRVLDD